MPLLAETVPGVRAGVMLAGPYRPVDEALGAQVEHLADVMLAAGATQAQVDQELAALRALVDDLEAVGDGTYAGATLGGQPVAYWRSWLEVGDAARDAIPALDAPILALNGAYDWNVLPEELEGWHGAFEGTRHEARLLPCVTHALNCVSEPNFLKVTRSDIGAHVDAQVTDAVVGFLRANQLSR